MENRASDCKILHRFGVGSNDMDLLLDYVANPMSLSALPEKLELPLEDEAFAEIWKGYAREADETGFVGALRKRLVQLNFPVREGIGRTPEYLEAVKKGRFPDKPDSGSGLSFIAPDRISLFVHVSPAGSIGVMLAHERQDFVSLVQALTRKNEPENMSESLGAFMVSGYNNWDRIRSYKVEWLKNQGNTGSEFSWMLEFEKLKKQKDLYQDRFIIICSGPYSGVQAAEVGMNREEWREKSIAVRLEHECTHYFTRRIFSSMRKNIWDEMLADYAGIVAAKGHYNSDWFLKFLGLEGYPAYRPGGRMEKYLPDSLSRSGFEALTSMTVIAARHLQKLDDEFGPDHRSQKKSSIMLLALCVTGLTGLCRSDYRDSFLQAYSSACSCLKIVSPLKYFRNKNNFHSSNKHTGTNQARPANLQDKDFVAIYQAMAPKIFNYLTRLCRNKDLAEDILQETFFAVHQKFDAFENRSSLGTWIFRIATNKFLDSQRKAWSKVSTNCSNLEAGSLGPDPEQQAIISQDVGRLRYALQLLPLNQKIALFLIRFEGMKYREAAEVLGVPLSTVRMRIYKALVALKEHLKE